MQGGWNKVRWEIVLVFPTICQKMVLSRQVRLGQFRNNTQDLVMPGIVPAQLESDLTVVENMQKGLLLATKLALFLDCAIAPFS
jgi:hypothetical protein